MRKLMIIAALVITTLGSIATAAWAACPFGTTYICTQGYGGKVICACR